MYQLILGFQWGHPDVACLVIFGSEHQMRFSIILPIYIIMGDMCHNLIGIDVAFDGFCKKNWT
jgi:hypothetical protein